MSTTLLALKDLAIGPSAQILVEGLNFTFKAGKIYVILGENGVGKSTLLRTLAHEIPALSGKIQHASNSFRKKTFFIPQTFAQSCFLPVEIGELLSLYSDSVQKKDILLQKNLLPKNILHKTWDHLSGGERLRVLLACGFAENPDILLLDEPFNHLDNGTKEALAQMMFDFVSEPEKPRAIIMVSHEIATLKNCPENIVSFLHLTQKELNLQHA